LVKFLFDSNEKFELTNEKSIDKYLSIEIIENNDRICKLK